MDTGLPSLDQATTNSLAHPEKKTKKPILVAAFYPDGDIETFAAFGFLAKELTPPIMAAGNIYLRDMIAGIQLTVVFSVDNSGDPKNFMASGWYTSGGAYKCRTYFSPMASSARTKILPPPPARPKRRTKG